MTHHDLDVYPIPREKMPMFINEPWLVDKSIMDGYTKVTKEPDTQEDNIRIYVPIDLNKHAILRRLYRIILHYREANEKNEMDFSIDVNMLVSQIEIYDQIWYVRHMPEDRKQKHSVEAIELMREFVCMLEDIPDGGAECFPFELIDELKQEYGLE